MAFARVASVRVTILEDIPAYGFSRIFGPRNFVCRGATAPTARLEALADDGSGLFAAAPDFAPTTVYIQIAMTGVLAGTVREFDFDVTSDADAIKFGALRMGLLRDVGIDASIPAGAVQVEIISLNGNPVASLISDGTNNTSDLAIGGDYPLLVDYIDVDSGDLHRDLPTTVDAPYDHATSELWYAVITPAAGAEGTLTIDTTASGSDVGSFIGVWDGAFNLVASGTTAASGPSLLSVPVSGASTYYVGITPRAGYVDGRTVAESAYKFNRGLNSDLPFLGDFIGTGWQLDVSYVEGGTPIFWSVLSGTQEVP